MLGFWHDLHGAPKASEIAMSVVCEFKIVFEEPVPPTFTVRNVVATVVATPESNGSVVTNSHSSCGDSRVSSNRNSSRTTATMQQQPDTRTRGAVAPSLSPLAEVCMHVQAMGPGPCQIVCPKFLPEVSNGLRTASGLCMFMQVCTTSRGIPSFEVPRRLRLQRTPNQTFRHSRAVWLASLRLWSSTLRVQM